MNEITNKSGEAAKEKSRAERFFYHFGIGAAIGGGVFFLLALALAVYLILLFF